MNTYEFENLPPPKYNVGDYVIVVIAAHQNPILGRIDFVNGIKYLHPDPKFRYGLNHSPFSNLGWIPSHIMVSEDEILRLATLSEMSRNDETNG